MKISVLKYQSLLDVVVQETGTMENAFEVASANGMSISDDLNLKVVDIPEHLQKEQRVADIFLYRKIKPATEITAAQQSESPYGGIGYMKIESDFIIS